MFTTLREDQDGIQHSAAQLLICIGIVERRPVKMSSTIKEWCFEPDLNASSFSCLAGGKLSGLGGGSWRDYSRLVPSLALT